MNPIAWPGSMASQMFAVLFVGIIAAAALAFTVSDVQRRDAEERGRVQRVVDRVADLRDVLGAAPRGLRPVLLGPGPEAPRLVDPTMVAGRPDPGLADRLNARLGVAAKAAAYDLDGDLCRPGPASGTPPHPVPDPARPPPPPPPPPPSGPVPPDPSCRLVAMTLDDAQRVAIVIPTGPEMRMAPPPLGLLFLLVLSAAAALLAFAVARVATGPLRRLSRAAVGLGQDLDRSPLSVEGPLEVRHAASAFNAMQARLRQTLEERTQMLAAITHDLQTPMTRLRLRLEKVGEAGLREQLLADHQAMQQMIRDGLDLARTAGGAEELVELDVDSLLQSLCDDAVAAGCEVRISGDTGIIVVTRPQALTRCVSNLLDNAVKYAGAAELSATNSGGIVIQVADRGPGVPPQDLEAVLKPFFRLETSRSRQTGGVGLGLTIAKVLAERAGASLQLSNRAGGGLLAAVRFNPPQR